MLFIVNNKLKYETKIKKLLVMIVNPDYSLWFNPEENLFAGLKQS
jgi:hypothetical protein